jgi:hypothetical protein
MRYGTAIKEWEEQTKMCVDSKTLRLGVDLKNLQISKTKESIKTP